MFNLINVNYILFEFYPLSEGRVLHLWTLTVDQQKHEIHLVKGKCLVAERLNHSLSNPHRLSRGMVKLRIIAPRADMVYRTLRSCV